MEQLCRRLVEVDRFRAVFIAFQAVANGGWKYCGMAQQPSFRFVHGEMLPETRVANSVLQFGFGPGALLICGRVWWERQRCAVQVQEADDGDQFAGIEIFRSEERRVGKECRSRWS